MKDTCIASTPESGRRSDGGTAMLATTSSMADRMGPPPEACSSDGVTSFDLLPAAETTVDWTIGLGEGDDEQKLVQSCPRLTQVPTWSSDKQSGTSLCSQVSALLQQHHERMEQQMELWMARQECMVETSLGHGQSVQQGSRSSPQPTHARRTSSTSQTAWTPHHVGSSATQADRLPRAASQPAMQKEISGRLGRILRRASDEEGSASGMLSECASAIDFRDERPARRRKLAARRENTIDVEDQVGNSCHGRLTRLVQSNRFEILCGFFIMSNAIFIGTEVNYLAETGEQTSPPQFYVIQHVYAVVFFIEWVLRLVVYNRRFFSGDQLFWHLFDTLIVAFSVFESALDVLSLSGSYGIDPLDNVGSLRIVRILRITRLIRIFRISRIVRFIQALRTLVYSIVCTLKSLVWALMLLMMIIYCFGIIFTQTVLDYRQDHLHTESILDEPSDILVQFWGRLPDSMFTLFMSIVGGISWHEVIGPLFEVGSLAVAMFLIYIAFTYFAVLNVVTAVFCQSAIESAQRDQEMVVNQVMAKKQEYISDIRKLFTKIDNDNSGTITMEEFEQHIQDDAVHAYFQSLELDTSDAWDFFKLLDTDRTNEIDIEEFVLGCLRMKGPAKGIDVARLLYEHKQMVKVLALFLEQSAGLRPHHQQSAGVRRQSFASGEGSPKGSGPRDSIVTTTAGADDVDVLI